MRAMLSDLGSAMRLNLAPPQPELLEMVRAKRVSVAPHQSAVLPPREWPTTPTRARSMPGCVSIQSITRLAPHAQAAIVPQASDLRTEGSGWNTACTPLVKPSWTSGSTSPLWNASAA